MMKRENKHQIIGFAAWLGIVAFFLLSLNLAAAPQADAAIKTLLINGQNNHNWAGSSPVLKQILEQTALFKVDTVTAPRSGQDMSSFQPDFSQYQLVVLDYTGDPWPEPAKQGFLSFVRNGGGVVVYHAASNAFPDWPEFNEITGLGGWGGRNESSGPYIYWKNGRTVRDTSPGPGGYHGAQHPFLVVNRNLSHPVTRGLPPRWMQATDELYSLMRGPAKNLTVLSTAFSSLKYGGTGRDEPVLFTVNYGNGRIFHTVLGHCMGDGPHPALESVGFIVTFQRGAEWAATGQVSQSIPGDFPGVHKDVGEAVDVRRWKSYRPTKIKDILKALSGYQYQQEEGALSSLREYVRSRLNSPTGLVQCEKDLVSFLKSGATIPAKQAVCRLLRLFATEQSLPVLIEMALDSESADIARYALEKIPDGAVDKALIEAVEKSSGRIRAGLVSSLGHRRSEAAVSLLGDLIYEGDSDLARAAVAALGSIGNGQAAKVIKKALNQTQGELKNLVADAYLRCADHFYEEGKIKKASSVYKLIKQSDVPDALRGIALAGIITTQENGSDIVLETLNGGERELFNYAIDTVHRFTNDAFIAELCRLLPRLADPAKIRLLEKLSLLSHPDVLLLARSLVNSENAAVKRSAIRILGRVGDSSVILLLAELAASGKGRAKEYARRSLWSLKGKDIDPTLCLLLITQTRAEIQAEIIQAIGVRKISDGTNLLFSRCLSANALIRRQAIRAVREIGQPSDLPQVIALFGRARKERNLNELEAAAAVIAGRIKQTGQRAQTLLALWPGLKKSGEKASFIRVLGLVGANPTLPFIRRFLSSEDESLLDAAVRALSSWSNTTPLDDLIKIATETDSLNHHVMSLNAAVRLIRADRFRSPQSAVKLLDYIFHLAKRNEEKKAVLGALPDFPGHDAIKLAESGRTNKELEKEAVAALEKIRKKMGGLKL